MKPTISAAVKIFGLVAVCLTAIGASIATAHRAASYVRGTAVPATAKDDGQKTSSAASAILTASSSFATGGVDEVAADGYDWTSRLWSIANSETFDEGGACGDVSDRATSIDAFDSAIARLDGTGFGTLMYNTVSYQAAGRRGEVDTSIQSSMVSNLVVRSFSGNLNEVPPDSMSYGGEFFSAHVNFGNLEDDNAFSLPLLFHTPSGCQGPDVSLDFYSAAALGFGDAIGGRIGYLPDVNETGPLDQMKGSQAIVFDTSASLIGLALNQAFCDVSEPPSYGPAAWAACSNGTAYVNTSVAVRGCEVLVSPARWIVIGDFFNQTAFERLDLWNAQFLPQQVAIVAGVLDYFSARDTATISLAQGTTQVGFELESANDATEWALVLVVALEALFMVVALVISSSFVLWSGWNNKRCKKTMKEAMVIAGKVASVAILLGLGFTPVYLARESESDAANMARNDVFNYLSETSTCFDAVWEGTLLNVWCVTTRLASNSLLVRSYTSTYLNRYDTLWWAATIVGGVFFAVYAVLSFYTVQAAQGNEKSNQAPFG
eukprot:jgi/Undpi1/7659/HiC_scaffold_23.g10132.m1